MAALKAAAGAARSPLSSPLANQNQPFAGCAAWFGATAFQDGSACWSAGHLPAHIHPTLHAWSHSQAFHPLQHTGPLSTRRMQGLWLQILIQYPALADFVRMYIRESAVKQRLMQQQQDMLCVDLRGQSLQVTYFWQTSVRIVILVTFTQLSEQKVCTLYME